MTEENDKRPKDIDSYINTPVHEQPIAFLLKSIPKRTIGLISKIIGVKMLLFAISTFIFIKFPDQFPWYAWIMVYIITIFGWDGLKFIDKIRK